MKTIQDKVAAARAIAAEIAIRAHLSWRSGDVLDSCAGRSGYVQDLLSDLMHFCAREKIDFDSLLPAAREKFELELDRVPEPAWFPVAHLARFAKPGDRIMWEEEGGDAENGPSGLETASGTIVRVDSAPVGALLIVKRDDGYTDAEGEDGGLLTMLPTWSVALIDAEGRPL